MLVLFNSLFQFANTYYRKIKAEVIKNSVSKCQSSLVHVVDLRRM